MRRNTRLLKLTAVMLVLGLCSALAGCTVLDRLWSSNPADESQKQVQDLPPEPVQSTAVPSNPVSKIKVDLYFADATGNNLVKESREIPKVEGIARATIEELIMGPAQGSGLSSTIPKGTSLEDINIKADGTCIVNFSPEFKANHAKGATNEALTVYSVVNTLTQFPSVHQVKFLVDGQEVETLAGHMDISTAMTRDDKIIKK